MAVQIFITVGSVTLPGELFDNPSARTVAALLPLAARPDEWGDEFGYKGDQPTVYDDTPQLQEARLAARQSRFEHGENGMATRGRSFFAS